MTPTTEGKQLAADLANACRHPGAEIFYPSTFDEGQLDYGYIAFARLATEHLALKAQLEEALADLREIDGLLEERSCSACDTARDIAAKHRTEPRELVDELCAALALLRDFGCPVCHGDCSSANPPVHTCPMRKANAALKRGYEIGGKSPQSNARVSVPDGQTPLNDKLGHRLLDVVKEGQAARDNGTVSPYHGHSLEHCLHAIGWVQRDLRITLDEMKGRDK